MLEDIQQAEQAHKGSFFILKGGQKLAEMTYSRAGDSLVIIDHTEVHDSLRGSGAGQMLVEKAVAWARMTNTRIMPLCPFARSVFDKNPKLRDVLI